MTLTQTPYFTEKNSGSLPSGHLLFWELFNFKKLRMINSLIFEWNESWLLCTSSLCQLKLKLKLLYLILPIFIRESKFELSTFCLEIPKPKILLSTLLSSTLLYTGDSLIFLPVQFSPATSSNIHPILPSLQ